MNQLSGYCEVKIKDMVIPCKFGMNAFAMFTQMMKVDLDQIDTLLTTSNVIAMRNLIYCGMKAAVMSSGGNIDFNEYTVGDWIDEMEQDELNKIADTIANARILGKRINGDTDEDSKKKNG